MPAINVLSKHSHTSWAKNAGRLQAVSEIVFPMFVASVWSPLRSEAGYRLMLVLMILQRNKHIMNLLQNVVWVSLFLRAEEFRKHPNSCTKPLPGIDFKSEKGWELPCQQDGFHVPHVGIGKRWRKSKDSCQILTQGNDPELREHASGQVWNPDYPEAVVTVKSWLKNVFRGLPLKALPPELILAQHPREVALRELWPPGRRAGRDVNKGPNTRGLTRMLQEARSLAWGAGEPTACSCWGCVGGRCGK